MKALQKLAADVEAEREAFRKVANTAPAPELNRISARVKAAADKLVAALTEGAAKCPTCGAPAHGMLQNFTIGKEARTGVEIGCLHCPDHHALGLSQEDAVERWNNGPATWLKPKKKPSPTNNASTEPAAPSVG
jgi:hypothetical protein